MEKYKRLTLNQRLQIDKYKEDGLSDRKIAEFIGVSNSTV